MNHSYSVFLDKNLPELYRIYREQATTDKAILVIQVSTSGEIQVFAKPLTDLPAPIQTEFMQILQRDPILLEKDRHIITTSHKLSESFCVLILDPKKHYCLRGFPEPYAFEFETFLEKVTTTGVSVGGQWMNQPTQVGQKYLQICRAAAKDSNIFKNFRATMDYQNIIIGGDHERNLAYYKLMEPLVPDCLKNCDTIGNPPINPETGYSTYTLRCLYTVRDIEKHFGSLENKNIVEIGSGHGGLCHVMSAVGVKFKSYTLIDLPEVNQLARKYLADMPNIKYMSAEEIIPRKYDLVISEYCLSELDLKGQNYYLDNVMKYCQGAYLAMNIWNTERKTEMQRRLSKYFKKIEEYPEEPTSKYPNYKLLCKKN